MSFGNDRVLKAKLFEGVSSKRNYADVLTGFENGITKLIGYSDGTTRPTGVFGGSATNLTKASNSVNPIENSFSLKLARTAAAQGQGYYFDFVPSRKDKLACANLNIKFAIELLTGTFSGSVNPSVDSDLIIGVWDMANNKNIEPSTRLLEPMVTNYIYNYNSSFQIPINATTLRVYIHSATTNSATFEVNLDDIEISRSNSNGVIMRPPVGTIISFGSVTPPVGFLYCDGSAVSRTTYAKLFQAIGIGYGSGDGSTTFNLPNAKGVFLRGAGTQVIGGENRTGNIGTTENDQFQGHRHSISDPQHSHSLTVYGGGGPGGTTFSQVGFSGGGGFVTNIGGANAVPTNITVTEPSTGINGAPRVGAETRPANITVAYHICFDDGNVQLGNIYDSAKLSARVQTASQSITIATQNQITFNSSNANINDAGMVETNQIRIKTTDEYDIFFRAQSQITNASEYVALFYKINSGSTVLFGQAVGNTGTYCQPQAVEKLQLNAGDILTFYVQTGIGTTIFTPTIIVTKKDKQSSQSLFNQQKQKAKYSTLSGQAVSTSTKVNFGTKIWDTHDIVSDAGSNFLIKPKKAGFLKILTRVFIQAAVDGVGSTYNIELFKNNSLFDYINFELIQTNVSAGKILNGEIEVETLATDTWYVAISTNNGSRNIQNSLGSSITIEVE